MNAENDPSPGIGSEDMVMPIHRAEIGIEVPALTDEFDAGNIVLLMGVLQRGVERNGLSTDGFDPRYFEVFGSSIAMPSSMFTWNFDASATVMLCAPAFESAVCTVFPGRGIPFVGSGSFSMVKARNDMS